MAPCIITATESSVDEEVMRLYREYAPSLSRYAVSLAQNQESARDAVQEVFLRYVMERRSGREIGNPRAWLYHVLRNYLLDWHRTVSNREVIADDLDHIPGAEHSPERILHRSEVARSLESMLSEREFECLRLRAEGLDYSEIARTMGIRSGTVGALLTRAQKKVRESASRDNATPLGAAEAIRALVEQRELYS